MISEKHHHKFWSMVNRAGPNDCWEWQGNLLENGYGRFWCDGKAISTHRIAWSLSNGKIPVLSVLHSCDNRRCCNPTHLREGTTAENMNDKVLRHRTSVGEKNGRARLSEWHVAVVRLLYSQGVLQKYLARDFRVSQTTISAIVRGETWKEVLHGFGT